MTRFAFALSLGLAAALAAGAADAQAPSGVYKLDPTHASLHWKAPHLGLSFYTARFTKFDATLTYDAAKPEASKLEVTIDSASVETDYPFASQKDFDAEIRSAGFLDAAGHPTIRFVSTKFERTGETTGRVVGDLSLRGAVKPVTLDVTLNGALASHPFAKVGALGVSAVGALKRSDFGVAAGLPAVIVGDEIKLVIEAEFIQQKN